MTRRFVASGSLACVVACALFAAPSAAHRLAPSYLELVEAGDGRVAVVWKTPRLVTRGTRLSPLLPCEDASEPVMRVEATAVVAEWDLACGGRSLVGTRVGVVGLEGSGTDGLIRVVLADGREIRTIVTSDSPDLVVPAQESSLEVARSYAWLGVTHLWTGIDHVLFVLGLLALIGANRALVIAITSFTLGHSLTLAVAALGWWTPPPGPVEVAIAATLVVLALELARKHGDPHAPPSLLARRPGIMPFAFGLLHGLGFAGALAELGLPAHAIPLALFSFNVGIEVGQLAIVALALPVVWLAGRRAWTDWPRFVRELPATAIGSLGVYWGLQRAVDAWLA